MNEQQRHPKFCDRLFGIALAAGICASGCSFKDFDYLQRGGGGTSGNAGSDTGGKSVGGQGGDSSGGSGTSTGGTTLTSTAGATSQGGTGGTTETSTGGTSSSGGTTATGGSAQGGTSSGTTGTVISNFLANPSFESDLIGWTIDPASAVSSKYVFAQLPTSGSTTVDGVKEFSAWHGTAEYSVTVSQIVSGLSPGTYVFKGSIASDKCQQAYLFARNCGSVDQQVPIPTDNWNWREFSIPSIVVTGSSCEVGFFLHNIANDWLNADHFAFELVAKTTP